MRTPYKETSIKFPIQGLIPVYSLFVQTGLTLGFFSLLLPSANGNWGTCSKKEDSCQIDLKLPNTKEKGFMKRKGDSVLFMHQI